MRLTAGVLLLALIVFPGMAAAEVNLYVAPSGAQYTTVQSAIDAVPANNTERYVINIAAGTYYERLNVPSDKPYVTFRGQDPCTTILTYNWNANTIGPAGTAVGTTGSSSTFINGHDFIAEGVTFQNSFGGGVQAVAIKTQADRLIFYNCRFSGWQDTLYANNGGTPGRQYYESCYIEGHVDFIFGNGKAYFENCEVRSRASGAITAQSKDDPNLDSGYVFHNCRVTRNSTLPNSTVDLGRPWRAYATVIFDECWMDSHVRARGWIHWNDTAGDPSGSSAFYAEHSSTGPGANPSGRADWSHQLTDEQAEAYSKEGWLAGSDNWNPQIPEPASVALLGLGAAAVLRRRRR